MTVHDSRTGARRTHVQTAAIGIAAVSLLIGVLGFVPGITTDHHQLHVAGHESEAQLLGLFQVSILHNVVHLLFGAVGVIAARSGISSRGYLVGAGVVYLMMWLYGVVVDDGSHANFVPLDNAGNWLHLLLGIGMLGLGLTLDRDHVASRASMTG